MAVTWNNLSLENGWQSVNQYYGIDTYYDPQYARVACTIKLRGSIIKDSYTGQAWETLFTLPSDYRPSKRVIGIVLVQDRTDNEHYAMRVDVQTDGRVQIGTFNGKPAPNGLAIFFDGFEFTL